MGRQDSINLAQVEGIVAEYGWLGEHKIGDEANGTLWLVVQHASLETQEQYLPVIEASVLRGETPASKLAFLRDRIAYNRREKQYYGTQVVQIKETGKYKPYPIADPGQVDQRRQEIGLEPDVARQLVAQTIRGAGALLIRENADPAALREAVTSPGGTTAAALDVMNACGFEDVIVDAITAARDRGVTLDG